MQPELVLPIIAFSIPVLYLIGQLIWDWWHKEEPRKHSHKPARAASSANPPANQYSVNQFLINGSDGSPHIYYGSAPVEDEDQVNPPVEDVDHPCGPVEDNDGFSNKSN